MRNGGNNAIHVYDEYERISNDLLAPERKGRAGKSGGILSGLGGARPLRSGKRGVKRTHKGRAASPRGCSRHRTLPRSR